MSKVEPLYIYVNFNKILHFSAFLYIIKYNITKKYIIKYNILLKMIQKWYQFIFRLFFLKDPYYNNDHMFKRV